MVRGNVGGVGSCGFEVPASVYPFAARPVAESAACLDNGFVGVGSIVLMVAALAGFTAAGWAAVWASGIVAAAVATTNRRWPGPQRSCHPLSGTALPRRSTRAIRQGRALPRNGIVLRDEGSGIIDVRGTIGLRRRATGLHPVDHACAGTFPWWAIPC